MLKFHRRHHIAVAVYAPLTAVVKARPGPLDGVYEELVAFASEQRLRGYFNKMPSFKLTPKEVERIAEVGKVKHFRGFWNNRFAEDDRS